VGFRVLKPLPPGTYQIEWTAYVRQHYHSDGGVIPFSIAQQASSGGSLPVTPAAAPPIDVAPPAAPD